MTKLLYMEDFNFVECSAKIIDIIQEHDKKFTIILDQTVFYPQGGGQPYDKGKIVSNNAIFIVEEVRFIDGIVKHIGFFESGIFKQGDEVKCLVDKSRRDLHSKLHSAGHVVDIAVEKLNLNWIPGKAYHFPEGPYVEYAGSLENVDKEKLKVDIENLCNQLIQNGKETKLLFLSNKNELAKICKNVPDFLPDNKPIRVVMYGDIAIPCGGTHVKNIAEIKGMTIRKLKLEKNNIRVSYDIIR